jgi:hypothetical protein
MLAASLGLKNQSRFLLYQNDFSHPVVALCECCGRECDEFGGDEEI